MLPYWLRYGILYGIIGISVGTIAAAIRALTVNSDNVFFVLNSELIIASVLICSYGLLLMKKANNWTTITALNYGFVGAFTYFLLGTIINIMVIDSNFVEIINNVTMTHGYYFLILITMMSMAPVIFTQRA